MEPNTGLSADPTLRYAHVERVRVENWMIFSQKAEFILRKNINIIAGGNGTGKSSLVCAIAIGLGYSPAVLLRGKKLEDYIAQGKTSALVCLQLRCWDGNQSTQRIVKRHLKKNTQGTDTISTLELDGEQITPQTLRNFCSHYHIIIDNLATFLPQERVAELLNLSEIKLLDLALECVSPELVHTKQNLISAEKISKELKIQEVVVEREKIRVNDKAAKWAQVERKYREYEEQHRTLWGCKLKIAKDVFDHLEMSRQQHVQVAEEKKKKIIALELKATKTAEIIQKIRKNLQEMNDHQGELRANLYRIEQKHTARRFYPIQTFTRKLEERLQIEMQNIEQCAEKVIFTTQQLTENQTQHPQCNPIEFYREIQNHRSRLFDLNSKIQAYENFQDDFFNSATQHISDQDAITERYLRQLPPQVGTHMRKAGEAIRNYKFSGHVQGPLLAFMTLKTKEFAWLAEYQIGYSILGAYACDGNFSDLKYLQSLNVTTLKFPARTAPGVVVTSAMRTAGATSLLSDIIEAPDWLFSVLSNYTQVNRVILVQEKLSTTLQNALPQTLHLELEQQLKNRVNHFTYYQGFEKHSVLLSEYDRSYLINNVNMVPSSRRVARIFTPQRPTLPTLPAAPREAYEGWNQEVIAIKQKIVSLETQLRDLNKLEQNITQGKQLRVHYITLLRQKIAKFRIFDLNSELRTEIAEIQTAVALLRTYQKNQLDLQELEEKTSISSVDLRVAVQQVEEFKARITELKKDLTLPLEFKNSWDTAKQNYGQVLKTFSKLFEDLKLNAKKEIEKYRDVDCESLRAICEAKISHAVVDPNCVIESQNAQRELGLAEERLNMVREKIYATTECYNRDKKEFLRQLEPLLSQLSQEFDHLIQIFNADYSGCVSAIAEKDSDAANALGLNLQVFMSKGRTRATGRLSGGEKSIVTIIFVLALQSIGHPTFRVIDEINQGVDSANELRLYRALESIARARPNVQYLIFTPQMVDGLDLAACTLHFPFAGYFSVARG